MGCMQLTCTPCNVVGLDFVEDLQSVVLAGDVLNAADEDIELAWKAGTELLNGRDLILSANDAGDGPRAVEQKGCHELGNLAVAAEEENVVRHD